MKQLLASANLFVEEIEKDGESWIEALFFKGRKEGQRKERKIRKKSKGIHIHPFGLEN